MNRAEVFLGTTLESRFRLDVVVRDSPDLLVFQGQDLETREAVDIRMPRAMRGLSREELAKAVDTFTQEAEQLRRLSNASSDVERLLAFGTFEGPDQEHLAYCVFAHLEGKPLSQASPPLPLPRAVALLEPIATALATAHDLGVFHGDVRPENILAVDDAEPPALKLAFFTRATRLGNAHAARTFSAAYAAPEHLKKSHGDGGVGPATDTYGLALCLVELVTGQPPFSGSSPSELYKQAMDIAHRPTLRARGVSVPPGVDAVLERAVAVNAKLRWPSLRDFWSALAEATSNASPSVAIRPMEASALADAAEAALAELPSPPHVPPPTPAPPMRRLDEGVGNSQPPPRRRGERVVLIVSGVMLAVGAVLIALVLRRRPPVAPSAPPPRAPASASAVALASVASEAPPVARPVPEGMVRVPAGAFTMGKDDAKSERPAHRVTLTHAFYIDRTEVTIDKYNACVEQGACTPRIVHLKKTISGAWGCNLDKEHNSHPANCVDRRQASAYCAFANKRLPTEAEWEYAARGADDRDYPWGGAAPKSCTLAVLSGMTGACGDRHGPSPVGSAPDGASPFGALDMGGNVWEWVADDYAAYASEEATDPLVTSGAASDTNVRGVLRGGAWDYGPESAKTTYRLPFLAEAGNASIGIRCALSE